MHRDYCFICKALSYLVQCFLDSGGSLGPGCWEEWTGLAVTPLLTGFRPASHSAWPGYAVLVKSKRKLGWKLKNIRQANRKCPLCWPLPHLGFSCNSASLSHGASIVCTVIGWAWHGPGWALTEVTPRSVLRWQSTSSPFWASLCQVWCHGLCISHFANRHHLPMRWVWLVLKTLLS